VSAPTGPAAAEGAGLALHSVAIAVADLDAAAAWYARVLGFAVARQGVFEAVGARFVFLERGAVRIELVSLGGAAIPVPVDPPPGHLRRLGYKALVLETADLAAATRALVAAGATIVWAERALTDDLASTMIRDLDGNLINILGQR
jgi:catechol 2,3-dioxygenase-like lactoylglutathione lyase family enzyme